MIYISTLNLSPQVKKLKFFCIKCVLCEVAHIPIDRTTVCLVVTVSGGLEMRNNTMRALANEGEEDSAWEGDSMMRRNMMKYMVAAVVAAFILLCTSFVSIMHSTRSAMSAMSHNLSGPLAGDEERGTLDTPGQTKASSPSSRTDVAIDRESTQVQSTTVSDGGKPAAKTEVVVNRQSVPVPASGGIVETEVPAANGGSTQVQISVNSQSTGTSDTSTSSEFEMNSSSSSTSTKEVTIDKSE